jgi:hypothetical protein
MAHSRWAVQAVNAMELKLVISVMLGHTPNARFSTYQPCGTISWRSAGTQAAA